MKKSPLSKDEPENKGREPQEDGGGALRTRWMPGWKEVCRGRETWR